MTRSLSLALLLALAPSLHAQDEDRRVVLESRRGRDGFDYATNGSFQRSSTPAGQPSLVVDEATLVREAPGIHARWLAVVAPIRSAIGALGERLRRGPDGREVPEAPPPAERDAAIAALVQVAFPDGDTDVRHGLLLVQHLLHAAAAARATDSVLLRNVTAALARMDALEHERCRRELLAMATPHDSKWSITLSTRGGVWSVPSGDAYAIVVLVDDEVIVRDLAGERTYADVAALRAAEPALCSAWEASRP